MNGFLKATLTREKFQGLFVNTALGNFAGYVAGSLVTLASTRHVVERRGLSNLFGVLPRKKLVVHVPPHRLEWLEQGLEHEVGSIHTTVSPVYPERTVDSL